MADSAFDFDDHKKGDTFDGASFQILEDGVAVDLTNAKITMDIRAKAKDAAYVLRLSTESAIPEIEISGVTPGAFSILAQVIDIDAANYVYDIEITFASGRKKTWISGKFPVIQDVTHD